VPARWMGSDGQCASAGGKYYAAAVRGRVQARGEPRADPAGDRVEEGEVHAAWRSCEASDPS